MAHYGAAHPSAHPELPLVAGPEGGGTPYKVGYLMPDVMSEGGAEAPLPFCPRHLFMTYASQGLFANTGICSICIRVRARISRF